MGLHVDATAYFLFICFVVTCILNRRSQTKSRRRCVFYGGTARVEPATDQGCSGAGTRWNAVPANILQLPRCWDLGLGNRPPKSKFTTTPLLPTELKQCRSTALFRPKAKNFPVRIVVRLKATFELRDALSVRLSVAQCKPPLLLLLLLNAA